MSVQTISLPRHGTDRRIGIVQAASGRISASVRRGRPHSGVGADPSPITVQPFPPDACALIYKPARAATTSGSARSRMWKLKFEPRAAPFLDPLTGWTGSEDVLTQIELSFPSLEAAITYARRQGLHYRVPVPAQGDPDATSRRAGHLHLLQAGARRAEAAEEQRKAA